MRYTLSYHHDPAGPHVDLFLETPGGLLETWRLPAAPQPLRWTLVKLLLPHRVKYLTYSGPVYPRRGWVRTLGGGRYEVLAATDAVRCLRVTGGPLAGVVRVERRAGEWWLRPRPGG